MRNGVSEGCTENFIYGMEKTTESKRTVEKRGLIPEPSKQTFRKVLFSCVFKLIADKGEKATPFPGSSFWTFSLREGSVNKHETTREWHGVCYQNGKEKRMKGAWKGMGVSLQAVYHGPCLCGG